MVEGAFADDPDGDVEDELPLLDWEVEEENKELKGHGMGIENRLPSSFLSSPPPPLRLPLLLLTLMILLLFLDPAESTLDSSEGN